MVTCNSPIFSDDERLPDNSLDKTLTTLRQIRNHRLAASKRKLFKEKRLLQGLENALRHEQQTADKQYQHYQAIRLNFVIDLQKSNNHKRELAVSLDNEFVEKTKLASIKENIAAIEQQKQVQHKKINIATTDVRQREIKVEKLDYLYPRQ